MGLGNNSLASGRYYFLAGLQTGIVAAIVMLAWLGLAASWYRKSFWTPANLMASTFYGESALRNRFTWHTFSGLALFFLIYGSLGVLFALAVRERPQGLRITCAGILLSIGFFYVIYAVWRHWNPLLVLYTHDRPMFAAHVIYGAMLGGYPRTLRRLLPARETALEPAGQAGKPAPLALE